ncbi:MAG: hypothetical protein ABI778_11095, partial [Ignavibacteriota bacterium]
MQRIVILFLLSLMFSGVYAQDGWILRKSGTTTTLTSISSADGQNVVAVGLNSTVVVSHSGGVGWQLFDNFRAKQTGFGRHLFGVASMSDKIFCAVGLVDSIYRSTDKGNSWIGIGSALDACTSLTGIVPLLSAIDFDSASGVAAAVGVSSLALFSTDLGKSWTEGATVQQA